VRKKRPESSRELTSEIIGPKKLTRFEKARIVGARALQIAMGAPILIDIQRGSGAPIDIALLELDQHVLPINIRRTLPDGTSRNIPIRLLLGEERER